MPPAGLPRDLAQWLALALALAAFALTPRLLRATSRPRLFAALAALAATALSAAYVAVYLRGGPRIIDATSYFIEARGFAEGLLSFPIHAPETSVLGRFLVRSEHADGPHAAVIFPPGWPAILALGFLARAPLAVGPILAAGITIATFDLAGHLARSLRAPASPSIPQLAVLLSIACAALRYHTADTMSHGLSALCVTSALALSFRALDARAAALPRRAAALAAGAGLASGWLFATRPISALALAVTLAFVFLRDDSLAGSSTRARRTLIPSSLVIALALGAIPGVVLFFAHQRAATGAWGLSSQQLYYAVSDGPPGCFRYGFGKGIGCIGEHGDFVRARLADGFGVLAAAGTTLRRLKMHLVDPLNLEPLALLVLAGAWMARRSSRGRALGLAVIAQVAAYVPFYFDGNYPAGGARFFCDVLPVEHALAALAVVTLAARRRIPERWAAFTIALSLCGFAFRAGFDHAQLRDREGGRPMFLPADLERAGVTRGLVFVDTDHGFGLAYDPLSSNDLAIARTHGDALDRFAWEARGRPPAFFHHFVIPPGGGPATVTVTPIAFPPAETLSIEGEALWPPVAQARGFAQPEWASGTCASGARWLGLHAADARDPSFTVELPAPWLAGRALSPRVVVGAGSRGEARLFADGAEVRHWSFAAPGEPGVACLDLPPARVPSGAKRLRLEILGPSIEPGGTVALDRIEGRSRENN
ncbi:MAG: hypothetical protein QM820_50410 [Minicystis sp.]